MFDNSPKNVVNLEFLHFEVQGCLIEGSILSSTRLINTSLVFSTATEKIEARLEPAIDKSIETQANEGSRRVLNFVVSIPLQSVTDIKISLSINGLLLPFELADGRFFGLRCEEESAYWKLGRSIITQPSPGCLRIDSTQSNFGWLLQEVKYQWRILKGQKGRTVLPYRMLEVFRRFFPKTGEIWLVSDRLSRAGDNAEVLFRHVQNNPVRGVHPYFVISKNCPDYKKMKHFGPTVKYGSLRYKRLFLKASKIISASGDDYVTNAFGKRRPYIKDLFQFTYVFLQHGVTKDDISGWLSRRKKNIGLFLVASKREAEAILENPAYGYSDSVVCLTGFPRHDLLAADPEKMQRKILLMPTWRNQLASKIDFSLGQRPSNSRFTRSEYFCFYNTLINDPRLLKALEKNDYHMNFVLHPAHREEAGSFSGNSSVSVLKECDYASEFTSAALMITDYSSAAFDYALLRKPLLYTQFDREDFFSSHIYKPGYFDYWKDGFGPVCENLSDTVDAIISSIEGGCKLEESYRRRIDAFFFTPQKSRCETVLEAILQTDASESSLL